MTKRQSGLCVVALRFTAFKDSFAEEVNTKNMLRHKLCRVSEL